MSWNGKNETSRKSLVSWKLSIIQRLVDRERRKLDTYSCKCINFGRSKTLAFFKNHAKIHILSLDQIVRRVMGSFEFLTRDYFFLFVDWTRVVWATRVSGQWYRSDRDGLPCSRKVKSFADVWSWTCLAALDAFDVICVQKRTKLSHGAPVQLLSLILGLSSAWWRIGSRSLGTSGFVVSPCNLQVFRQHSTLYLCTSGVPTTRRQYGAELFTLGALFLANMAMAGSATLNVEMILRVIPPLKSNGWLVLLPHRLCWTWSSAVAHWVTSCSTQRCRCRNCKGHFDWNEVCLCTNCENQSHQ